MLVTLPFMCVLGRVTWPQCLHMHLIWSLTSVCLWPLECECIGCTNDNICGNSLCWLRRRYNCHHYARAADSVLHTKKIEPQADRVVSLCVCIKRSINDVICHPHNFFTTTIITTGIKSTTTYTVVTEVHRHYAQYLCHHRYTVSTAKSVLEVRTHKLRTPANDTPTHLHTFISPYSTLCTYIHLSISQIAMTTIIRYRDTHNTNDSTQRFNIDRVCSDLSAYKPRSPPGGVDVSL